MRSVVVTGVSTGIGWGTCKVLLQNGFQVFGSVRNERDATRLKAEFGRDFHPLVFDVTDQAAVQSAANYVEKALDGQTLAGLVNNAGMVAMGPLAGQSLEEVRQQIEVNVIALLGVTQIFLPLLGMDGNRRGKPGRIVNISSISGSLTMPFLGAYSASKFAVEGLSGSLRQELVPYGIDVILIAPGSVATAVWDKAERLDLSAFAGSVYGKPMQRLHRGMLAHGRESGMAPEELGRVVLAALTAATPRWRYEPVAGKWKNWFIPRLLPVRMRDGMIASKLGLTPPRRGHAL